MLSATGGAYGPRPPTFGMASLVLGAALAVTALTGCAPDSDVLCGRWQSRVTTDQAEGSGVLLPGGLELYIGHYGRDVVGVLRFYDREFGIGDDCGINDPPAEGCGCMYISNGNWSGSRRRFTFAVNLANGRLPTDPACLPDSAEIPADEAVGLEFDLILSSNEDSLTGTLRWIDSPDATTQTISMRRLNCQDCDDTLGAQCGP